jgi:hypothetical protein
VRELLLTFKPARQAAEELGLRAYDGSARMVFLSSTGNNEIRILPARVESNRVSLSTSAISEDGAGKRRERNDHNVVYHRMIHISE